jgi:hypothetical protein
MLFRLFSLILVVFVVAAFVANLVMDYRNPVKLVSEDFKCLPNTCSYEYKLINTSDTVQQGDVVIHARENDSPVSYKLDKAYLGFIKKPFVLKPNQELFIVGEYPATKKLWLFFRLGEN